MIPQTYNNSPRQGGAKNPKSFIGFVLQPLPGYFLKINRMQHETNLPLQALTAIGAVRTQCPDLLKSYRPKIHITGTGDETNVEINVGMFKIWILPESLKKEEGVKENFVLFLNGTSKKSEPVSICDSASIAVVVNSLNGFYNHLREWSRNLKPIKA